MDFDKYVEEQVNNIEKKMNQPISFNKEIAVSLESIIDVQEKMRSDIKKMVVKKYIKDSLDGTKKYVVVNKVKEAIKKSPYTQREIAKKINVSERTLSNIANNKYNTSLEVALKLSYLLDISMDDLFELRVVEI